MQPEYVLDWGTQYGAKIVPLYPNEKKPIGKGWQLKEGLTPETLYSYREQFGEINLGLLLGKDSGNLVDIDLDCREARMLGGRYLPKTEAMFGRGQFPKSHVIYVVSDCEEHVAFIDPVDGKTLLEIRGTGHQSMMPPSVHPEGERITWSSSGEPAKAEWKELVKAGGRLAFAAFLAKHWFEKDGSIHFIVLGISGALLRAGLEVEEIEGFIRSACDVNGDDGTEMQVRAVRDTAKNLDEGKEVTGWPTLEKFFDEKTIKAMRQWLGIEQEEIPFERTDKYNATLLVKYYGDRIRFNPESQMWYVWNGSYWEQDIRGMVLNFAAEVGDRIKQDAIRALDPEEQEKRRKHGLSSRNLARMKAMLTVAAAEAEAVVLTNEFDRNDMLLNCPNGVLDLETQVLEQPKKEHLITKVTGTKFDPSARCPRFMRFIERIIPDPLTRRYLQKIIGYSLTGQTVEEKFFLFYGPLAQNGKSTLMSVIHAMMGTYSMHASKDSFMKQMGASRTIRDDIAHMVGARFISLSEPQDRDVFDTSVLKDFTGGDLMRVRHLFQKEFQFKPKGKLIIPTNFLPGANALDPGLWRRTIVIPFTVRIPDEERDNSLKDYLREHELSGIFNWVVEGTVLYLREGLDNPPAEVVEATQDYQHNNDSTAQFLDEMTEADSSSRIDRQTLFAAYSEWCKSMGYRRVAVPDFVKAVELRGYPTVTFKGAKRWSGIKLRPDDFGDALFNPKKYSTSDN